MNWFSSTPGQFKQAPSSYTQPQQAGFAQALQMALGGLQDPYKGFAPIEQRARSQWQSNTLPSLIEQFTVGAPSGERSSAFAGALGGAGTDLEESLAAMRSQYGLQQQGLSQRLLGMGLTPQNQYMYQQEGPSGIMQLLQMLAKGAGGAGAGFMMGGPAGAIGGGLAGLGSGFSDMFGRSTERMMPGTVARGLPGQTMF